MIGKIILSGLLFAASWQDIRKKEISMEFVLAAAAAAVAWMFLRQPAGMKEILLCLLPGIALIICSLLSGGATGAGDGVIFLISGCFLGPAENLSLICLSFLIAGIVAGFLLIFRKWKKQDTFPFLPCVFAACLLQLILDGGLQ